MASVNVCEYKYEYVQRISLYMPVHASIGTGASLIFLFNKIVCYRNPFSSVVRHITCQTKNPTSFTFSRWDFDGQLPLKIALQPGDDVAESFQNLLYLFVIYNPKYANMAQVK